MHLEKNLVLLLRDSFIWRTLSGAFPPSRASVASIIVI